MVLGYWERLFIFGSDISVRMLEPSSGNNYNYKMEYSNKTIAANLCQRNVLSRTMNSVPSLLHNSVCLLISNPRVIHSFVDAKRSHILEKYTGTALFVLAL